ncbi:SCO family protein [Sphingomonas sp. G-3-2-10]|uniref:SCO family protein n=1 Tax=Sphingomonas sp. G-3-2-10 TaxID=2728838 RepID=UPI00146EB5B3|nr:SCO family protein [Sphingomonas sp. G-3-2-10]NML05621.1 SCO family protein [Sphingomonas sp. G-3-2-10]
MSDVETETPNLAPRSALARFRLWLWIGVAVAAVALAAALMLRAPAGDDASKSYSAAFGGSFTMTDQNGRTVTEKTLRGRPYAIFFGFTRCPDVCPTTLTRMAQLRKALGADGMKFDIIFVSVDPQHDTREGIREYLGLFDTPIIGLSGTAEQLAGIVKAFHVFYEKVPVEGGDYTIDHTASIFLMDREGRFVTTIDHKEGQEVAVQKLRRVIDER